MVVIVVDSMTGLGKKFALKFGYEVFDIATYQFQEQHQILLITRSINFGEIPDTTQTFLEKYAQSVIATAVGGNRTWGKNFGAAGDKIKSVYQIPLIVKFEGIGFPHEVQAVKNWLEEYQKGSNI
jgi:protein involved in ribonucleotide reduction